MSFRCDTQHGALQMLRHLGEFPRRLAQHAHAVYEYTPAPPVGYPELADEVSSCWECPPCSTRMLVTTLGLTRCSVPRSLCIRMPAVGCSIFDRMLQVQVWCHRYYLRNLCDEERFPDWPIVDHVPFLQVRSLNNSSPPPCLRRRQQLLAASRLLASGIMWSIKSCQVCCPTL